MKDTWLDWAIALQSIAQAGLTYGKDVFDLERYEQVREIAASMIAHQSQIPLEKVKTLFCNEEGYQTPKLDTRAAIFKDDAILLVQEHNGKWSLPGGWVDVDLSIKENTIKEVKEEAGLDVETKRIIAIHDRDKHNQPRYAYGVCKIFVECVALGGSFQENSETLGCAYFKIDELPNLELAKNNKEQVLVCFEAHSQNNWIVQFD